MICSMIINLIQLERKLMTLTKEEMQQLTDEFIHFQMNQMTREEMASYVYNSMRKEINGNYNANYSLKKEIDDEDLRTVTDAVIEDLELDERFYHKPVAPKV